jgi:Ring finger domain
MVWKNRGRVRRDNYFIKTSTSCLRLSSLLLQFAVCGSPSHNEDDVLPLRTGDDWFIHLSLSLQAFPNAPTSVQSTSHPGVETGSEVVQSSEPAEQPGAATTRSSRRQSRSMLDDPADSIANFLISKTVLLVGHEEETEHDKVDSIGNRGDGNEDFEVFVVAGSNTRRRNVSKNNANDDGTSDHHRDMAASLRHGSVDDPGSSPPACAICLIDYQTGDIISFSHNPRCQHFFHHSCITEWILTQHEEQHQAANAVPPAVEGISCTSATTKVRAAEG